MAGEVISPNMNMPVPTAGVTSGPQFAIDITQCLNIIDSHDHTPGYGVQITPDGININGDLTFADNNAINLRSARFQLQSGLLGAASDLACLYATGVDLYFNDASGNQVRITQNGALAGTPGSIANLVAPASASYDSGSTSFIWQSNTLTAADMDFASAILRNLTASSFGLTLSPPTLSSDYTITLPALPGSTLPLVITSSGTMSAAQITYAQLAAAVQALFVPTGAMMPYGGTAAPTGFLLCNGLAVSRSTYSALFGIIGTAYGSGDGSTTFNVPDKRWSFSRGFGADLAAACSGSAASNNVTATAHGYNRSGVRVRVTGTPVTGLSTSTNYWTIWIDANTLAFGSTRANAIAGTKITISGSAASMTVIQYMDPDAASRVAGSAGGGTGANVGSFQEDSNLHHNHTATVPNAAKNSFTGAGRVLTSNTGSDSIGTGEIVIAEDGGTESRPLNNYDNFIIKT